MGFFRRRRRFIRSGLLGGLSEFQALLDDLFGGSKQGLIFIPQPFIEGERTLYQVHVATSDTDVDGDPVGLGLEWSESLRLGDQLVANGTFNVDTTGWSPDNNVSQSIDSQRLRVEAVSGTNSYVTSQSFTGVVGRKYAISATVESATGNSNLRARARFGGVSGGAADRDVTPESPGVPFTGTRILEATSTSISVQLGVASTTAWGEIGDVAFFDNISVRELFGNHLTQATSADRPTYNTDGSLHWLAHDGVGDYLQSSTGLNADVDEFWLFFAGEHSGGDSVVFSLTETGSQFQYLRLDKTQIFVRAESSQSNQVTAAVTGTDTTAVWSIRARKSDRTVTVWRNRVQEAQVTAPGTDWFPAPFFLTTAGGKNGAAAAATVGRGYVWVLDAVSATDVERVEDYLANRAGITL